jgi:hypothetical protein
MTIKPKWDSKSAGEYERSLTLRDIKVEDDDDIQDYKKQWVGLTPEDWDYIEKNCGSIRSAIKTAEALLKEKNT